MKTETDISPADRYYPTNLQVYKRSYMWESIPATAKGIRTGAVTALFQPPQIDIDTGAGANRIYEFCENMTLDPFEFTINGEIFAQLTHIIRAIVRVTSAPVNPAGDCFLGIEFGSYNQTPPFTNAGGTNCQLRWNFTLQRWELAMLEANTAVIEIINCGTVPRGFSSGDPNVRELMIKFMPGSAIECYVDNTLIQRYTGPKIQNWGMIATDGGGGLFVTSGSNAVGRILCKFSLNEMLTLYYRAGSPD